MEGSGRALIKCVIPAFEWRDGINPRKIAASQSLGRDLNPRPLKYERGLTVQSLHGALRSET